MGRDVAWRALLEWGAPPKTVRLVPDMHQHTTCSLCAPGSGLRDAIGREMQQGDEIAFMLYNVYMDSVERDILSIIRHGGTKIRQT